MKKGTHISHRYFKLVKWLEKTYALSMYKKLKKLDNISMNGIILGKNIFYLFQYSREVSIILCINNPVKVEVLMYIIVNLLCVRPSV